jgi:LacI family transcriptional regulator
LNLLIYDIRENLAALGLDCIVTEAETPDGQSTVRRLVLQRKVDGIILLLESNRPEDWSLIKKRGIPVIHVHYMPTYFDTERLDYFFTDNVRGGRVATEALLDAGCRSLACLMDVCRNPEMQDREKGFVEAQLDRGLSADPRLRLSVENSFAGAYEAVRMNMGLLRKADGIFVTTDIMAQDYKIVGYDDIEICTYVRPTLSSVHQPHEEISRLACERLVRLLNGEGKDQLEQRLIAPTFVRRDSC